MKYKGQLCRVLKENAAQAYIEVDKGNEHERIWVDKTDIENYRHIPALINRMDQEILCNNCIHKEICEHKDDCFTLERSIQKPYRSDHPFIVEIQCRHFGSQTPKTSLDSYQMPGIETAFVKENIETAVPAKPVARRKKSNGKNLG